MLPDPSSDGDSAANAPSALALQVLRLEQRLESYQRLHEQELGELRRAVTEVKDQVLVLAAAASRSARREPLNFNDADQKEIAEATRSHPTAEAPGPAAPDAGALAANET